MALKRDHGIEVKNAGSLSDPVIASKFVERIASSRGLALPSGNMFAETHSMRIKKGTPRSRGDIGHCLTAGSYSGVN